MENVDVKVTINGLDDVQRLSDELQQSVEKTKALAGTLVKACNELSIRLDRETIVQAAAKAIDDSVQAHQGSSYSMQQ